MLDLERARLAERINALLPQTQCTRCGYPDCRSYAEALANPAPIGQAGRPEINQCPPGGVEGIERLAALTGRPALPLNPVNGVEAARTLAVIDEAWCIGCTLCIKACPVDCIVGAPKQMHMVVDDQCTGCELCVPACPVDCISLVEVTPGRTAWEAWNPAQALAARERHDWRLARRTRDRLESEARVQARSMDKPVAAPVAEPNAAERKRAAIEAALARARAKR